MPHLNLVIYGSGEGTNAGVLAAAQKDPKDPAPFQIRAFVVSGPCGMEALGHQHQIPQVIKEDYKQFTAAENTNALAKEILGKTEEKETPGALLSIKRTLYYKEVVEKVDQLVNPLNNEVFVFAGWNYIVTPNFFEYSLKRRVKYLLNVHPADLTILDEVGKRKYTGEGWKCVQQAVFDGAPLRTTIHIMTEEVDAGPLIVLGPIVPSEWEKGTKISMDEAKAFMAKKLKPKSDHPALLEAMKAIAEERWKLGDKHIVMEKAE